MPSLYIISGCNGAGKTTASLTVLPETLQCKEFVNCDEIAKGLSPLNPDGAKVAAGRLMLSRIKTLIADKADFAIETTLAAKSYHALIRLQGQPHLFLAAKPRLGHQARGGACEARRPSCGRQYHPQALSCGHQEPLQPLLPRRRLLPVHRQQHHALRGHRRRKHQIHQVLQRRKIQKNQTI